MTGRRLRDALGRFQKKVEERPTYRLELTLKPIFNDDPKEKHSRLDQHRREVALVEAHRERAEDIIADSLSGYTLVQQEWVLGLGWVGEIRPDEELFQQLAGDDETVEDHLRWTFGEGAADTWMEGNILLDDEHELDLTLTAVAPLPRTRYELTLDLHINSNEDGDWPWITVQPSRVRAIIEDSLYQFRVLRTLHQSESSWTGWVQPRFSNPHQTTAAVTKALERNYGDGAVDTWMEGDISLGEHHELFLYLNRLVTLPPPRSGEGSVQKGA